MKQTAASCKGEDSNGAHYTYTPLTVDPLGDDVVGIKIATSGAVVDTEIVLSGGVIVSVGAGSSTTADDELLAQVSKSQVDKVRAAS